MSSNPIRPSTMDGVKRLAHSIKIERGIAHLQAMEIAAQAAGYQNLKHAQNSLKVGSPHPNVRRGHRLYLTVPWHDKESNTRGRETLSIWLSTIWSDLITVAQLDYHRAFNDFRPEGPDHLAVRYLTHSQSVARRDICFAARTLQFMDTTNLRPSNSRTRALPKGHSSNAVPGRDHCSIWYDRATKRYLFADEPYEAAIESKAAERAAWAERHGYSIAKPTWPGMYNPDGGSRLYLVSDDEKGLPLAPVVAALERQPAPIVEATWDGESAPSFPLFVSPGTIARNESARAQSAAQAPLRVTNGPRQTVGYVQSFVGPQRRPKGSMPVETHAQVGKLLKSVLAATRDRKGVHNRVSSVRGELDEWVMREYSAAELPGEQFFDLYYHGTERSTAHVLSPDERDLHVGSMERVKGILVEHYPNCQPLRALVGKLDAAISSMQTWVGG